MRRTRRCRLLRSQSGAKHVFTTGDDPVQFGIVSSINRPGGNVTGVHVFFSEVESKKLGLLREVLPNADLIAAIVNPTFPSANGQMKELQTAANKLGQRMRIINASSEHDLDVAFASMKELRERGARRRRSVLQQPARPDCFACGTICHPCGLRTARFHGSGRVNELWNESS